MEKSVTAHCDLNLFAFICVDDMEVASKLFHLIDGFACGDYCHVANILVEDTI